MPDISLLSSATTSAGALNSLVLATPNKQGYQPQDAKDLVGPPGPPPPSFVFDYEGEQSITLTSDITDHFIENNTSIQDNISIKPEMVSTRGYIGELNDIAPPALAKLKEIANKLTVVGAYAPALSATALIAYNEAAFLYSVASTTANTAVSVWNTINGNSASNKVQTKQQKAFQLFYGYYQARTLFTIQTPWAEFTDMAITSLRAIQNEDTRMISDFEVSFKKMRFADTQIVKTDFQGRLSSLSLPEVNFGPVQLGPEKAFGVA